MMKLQRYLTKESHVTDNLTKEKEVKALPSISPDKTKQTTQGTNQKTMQQNSLLNTSETPNKDGGGIPIHEPKLIEKRNDQPNDMLNYSLSASTRAINKIPKGKYGYVEEYDLIKAEKFLSKRRSNVKYDPNIVYGKPTGSTIIHPNPNANTKVNADRKINDAINEKPVDLYKNPPSARKLNSSNITSGNKTQEIIEEKEEEDEDENNDYHYQNINKEEKYKSPIKRKKYVKINKENNDIEHNENKRHQIKRKNHSAQVSFENNEHNYNNNDNTYKNPPIKTEGTVNKENKNFHLLFKHNNPSPEIQYQPKEYLDYTTQTSELQQHQQQQLPHDIYSCDNCEPVYLLCIMSNEPLKVLKCLICNNLINKTSLEFYLNKYKSSIVSKKPKKSDKRQVKEDKVQKCADDTNLTEHWGRIIESNKACIQEKIIYDIVDGKSKLKPHQKEQYLNKVKNTPYEEIIKRKVILNIKEKK